jgi:hypothetical protein
MKQLREGWSDTGGGLQAASAIRLSGIGERSHSYIHTDQTIKALSIYACNLNELDLAVRETRERKAVDTKDERDHKASSHGADRLTAGGARWPTVAAVGDKIEAL